VSCIAPRRRHNICIEYNQTQTPGSTIIVTSEGTRPLLVEIQALVGTTPYPTPRRVANGVDVSRVLQILAVLENKNAPQVFCRAFS
jgi:DNA repair protein RadA/Sms